VTFCAVAQLVLFAGCGIAFGANRLGDPTRPPAVASPSSTSTRVHWQVTSILFSPQRRVAVVNGRLVTEGEEVDGARVLTIRPASVELRYRTHRLTIPMKAGIIKDVFSVRQKNEGNRTP